MLVDLTIDPIEVRNRKKISKELGFEYYGQDNEKFHLETGIYRCEFDFNFSNEEFKEKLINSYEINQSLLEFPELKDNISDNEKRALLLARQNRINKNWITEFGVADNVEQIKDLYKKEIDDTENKYVISLTPVFQDKENAGKYNGWRWHKWGEYIGNLKPKYEYLDDEDFGEDFEYVIVFEIHKVIEDEKKTD